MSDETNEQTAMERFRAALGKRGIEFETNDDECAEGEERTTLFKANLGEGEFDIFVAAKDWYFDGKLTPWLDVEFHNALTPEQAIAATLGNGREKALEELVRDWQVLAEARLDDEIALLKRITELEKLVRDMWFKNIGRMDSCGWCVIGCDDAEHCELQERIAALGMEVDG